LNAQYVASLDPTIAGMLAEMPRVGAAMLFARIDERGRVSLVRTGVLTHFEGYRREDPFAETYGTFSTSVETSAPPLTPAPAPPRMPRHTTSRRDPYEATAPRTQPVHGPRPRTPISPRAEAIEHGRQAEGDDATLVRASAAEYDPATMRRASWPPPNAAPRPARSTLRPPNRVDPRDDEHDPYAAVTRVRIPRASNSPPPPQTRGDRGPRSTTPPHPSRATSPTEKAAGRRRRDR
jgi:hypothetical protein